MKWYQAVPPMIGQWPSGLKVWMYASMATTEPRRKPNITIQWLMPTVFLRSIRVWATNSTMRVLRRGKNGVQRA